MSSKHHEKNAGTANLGAIGAVYGNPWRRLMFPTYFTVNVQGARIRVESLTITSKSAIKYLEMIMAQF